MISIAASVTLMDNSSMNFDDSNQSPGGKGEQSVKRSQQVSNSGYLVKIIIIQGAEAALTDPIHELRFNYITPGFFT